MAKGRILQGLDGYFANFMYPWANFAKGINFWAFSQSAADLAKIAANQYPTSQLSTSSQGIIDVPTVFNPPYSGKWVMKWTGTSACQVFGINGATATNGTSFTDAQHAILAGTSPRVVFTMSPSDSGPGVPGAGTCILKLLGADSGFSYSGMSGLIFCRLEDEPAIDAAISANGAGADSFVFNPDFVTFMKKLNPQAIRLLGMINMNNGSNQAHQYTYRAPLTSLTWWDRIEPKVWVGSITNAGGTPETYTCGSYTDMPGTWTHLETFHGIIAAAGTNTTVAPFINVGSRGAKPIFSIDASNSVGVGNIVAGNIYLFVYDSLLDGCMAYNNTTNGYMRAGPPIEVSVSLANQIGCDLWWILSHLITDADTTSIVSYARDHLGGKLRLALSNEIWNHFGIGESQGFYYVARGEAEGYDTISGVTNAATPAGNATLSFASLPQLPWGPKVATGMAVRHANVPNGTTVQSIGGGGTSIVMTNNATGAGVLNGDTVNFGTGTGGYISAYGLRQRQVHGLATTAWSPRSASDLVRILDVFSVQTGVGSAIQTYQLNGSDLGSFGYNASPNRPIDFAETIAIAPYWSGGSLCDFQGNFRAPMTGLKNAADDYASGVGQRMASALDFVYADMINGLNGDGTTSDRNLTALVTGYYNPADAMMATYDVGGVPTKFWLCYEGGPAFWYPTPRTTGTATLGIVQGTNGYALGIDTAPAWLSSQSYSSGAIVISHNSSNINDQPVPRANDLFYYTSVTNANAGNDPATDNGTNWTKGARSYSGKIYDLSIAFKKDQRSYTAAIYQFNQEVAYTHFAGAADLQLGGLSQFSLLIGDLYSQQSPMLQASIDFNNPPVASQTITRSMRRQFGRR